MCAMPNAFLRWPGSKRILLPVLLRCAPPDMVRYIEPFLGSACLFFALRPRTALLSDNNALLIETYKNVRDHPILIANHLRKMSTSRSAYYAARARLQSLRNPLEKSKVFMYLNRLCFNGVYRTNRNGHFNVPYGSRTGAMPTRQQLVACSQALKSATVQASDFEATLKRAHANDFVYLDPPYFKPGRKTYGEYGYGCFSDVDLDRLVAAARSASDRGAKVLLSYNHSARLLHSFRGWSARRIRTVRTVAAEQSHRTPQYDLLLANFNLPEIR